MLGNGRVVRIAGRAVNESEERRRGDDEREGEGGKGKESK